MRIVNTRQVFHGDIEINAINAQAERHSAYQLKNAEHGIHPASGRDRIHAAGTGNGQG